MKNPRHILLCACLLLTAARALAADAHTVTRGERYALDYINAHDKDDALDDELAKLGIDPASTRNAQIKSLVKAMRPLLADKLDPKKEAFWNFLAESMSDGATQPAAPASTAAVPSAIDAATTAVKDKLPKYFRDAVDAAEKATEPVKDYHAFFHTGLRSLAPYHVNGASAVDNSSTSTGGFLEFVYTDVWAWRPNRVGFTKAADQAAEKKREAARKAKLNGSPPAAGAQTGAQTEAPTRLEEFAVSAFRDLRNGWDFSSRLAFNFGGGDSASANTIAGSGDFNAEVAIDKHIFRGWTDTNAYSFNLGGSFGATTDKAALRVHPRYLFGPSFSAAFDDPLPGAKIDPRRALFTVRAGQAYVDSVRFLRGPGIPPLTLRTISPGIPRFSLARGTALEAELFYPFGLQSFVTLGARAYRVSDDSLSPWSLYIGITTPFSKAASGLFPK